MSPQYLQYLSIIYLSIFVNNICIDTGNFSSIITGQGSNGKILVLLD